VDVAGLLAPAGAEPVAVTLITGDTVWWQDGGEANPRLVEITQAPRDHPVTFDQAGTPDEFYVIPSDAMAHVVAGGLDAELFNIPGLIRQGLDDTASDKLPVIVTFDQDRSPAELASDADALPATAGAVAVQGINGAGVAVDRRHAGAFRTALLDQPGTAAAVDGSVLGGGVQRVWLDRMLQVDLSESVPQIGAPQAWAAGFTGEGVTVAVLDTGVDSGHPDLAGQVAAMANFTGEPDGTDGNGHGTHVASTIAGTGAASGGARTGVAGRDAAQREGVRRRGAVPTLVDHGGDGVGGRAGRRHSEHVPGRRPQRRHRPAVPAGQHPVRRDRCTVCDLGREHPVRVAGGRQPRRRRRGADRRRGRQGRPAGSVLLPRATAG
jgi:hypothetical protein